MSAPVFCPEVLPAPWFDVSNESSYGGYQPNCPGKGCKQSILSINGEFLNPSWYALADATTVAIWAISTGQETAPATVGLVGCPGAKLRRKTTFRGHSAGWYTCKDAETVEGANTVFQWTIGDEHYGVELDGSTAFDRRFAAFIVSHLVELKPHA